MAGRLHGRKQAGIGGLWSGPMCMPHGGQAYLTAPASALSWMPLPACCRPGVQLGQGKSAIGEFMKSARKNNDNFEEQLLKLVGGRWLGSSQGGRWLRARVGGTGWTRDAALAPAPWHSDLAAAASGDGMRMDWLWRTMLDVGRGGSCMQRRQRHQNTGEDAGSAC